MKALQRKLIRDLWLARAQAAAIAAVIAAGVMVLVVSVTSLDAVRGSQQRFYQAHAFADLFVELTRAPLGLADRVAAIEGVTRVEPRVRAPARLDLPGFSGTVRAEILSLPEGRSLTVNRLYLRSGRLPEPGRSDQVVVSEPFALAHALVPGDRLALIVGGRRQALTVSGVALSPEFVYQAAPGDILPDYQRFAILWMSEAALARSVDLTGAFNSLALTIAAGADVAGIQTRLDALLDGFGGRGAYPRSDQPSHAFLQQEVEQLANMAVILPGVFLGVAAFLVGLLMDRLVRGQRQQIAVLKAFGYSDQRLLLHYGSFAAVIGLLGAVLGSVLGVPAGTALAGLYAEYFRFPEWSHHLQPRAFLLAHLVAVIACLLGAVRSVRRAVREQPASAMRPPMPERFRHAWYDRPALVGLLAQTSRMILRNLGRQPLRAGSSVLGLALAIALVVLGGYQFGAVDVMVDRQYREMLRMDARVELTGPVAPAALEGLRALPDVVAVEAYRSLPVRLRHGVREERVLLLALDPEPRLWRLLGADGLPRALPGQGVLLTDWLAARLDLEPGDRFQLELLEPDRGFRTVTLAGLIDQPVGTGAYMQRSALQRLLDEGPALNSVGLAVHLDAQGQLPQRLLAALEQQPAIAAISDVRVSEQRIRDYLDTSLLWSMAILLGLAMTVAFAMVYNNARVTLAERARELATLRVMGYSRAEVAWVISGELLLLVGAAIPLGSLLGTGLAWWTQRALADEWFRLPFVVEPSAYALATGVGMLAAALTTLLVWVRIDRLQLVSVLKIE